MCGMILNLLNICGMISNFLIKSGSGSCPHILHLKCSLRNSIHTYLIANTLATLFTSDSMYVCTYVCAHHARARAHTHTHTHRVKPSYDIALCNTPPILSFCSTSNFRTVNHTMIHLRTTLVHNDTLFSPFHYILSLSVY